LEAPTLVTVVATMSVPFFTIRELPATGAPLASVAAAASRPFTLGRVSVWVKVKGPSTAVVTCVVLCPLSAMPTCTSSGMVTVAVSSAALFPVWRLIQVVPSSDRSNVMVFPLRVTRNLKVGPLPSPMPHGARFEDEGPAATPTAVRDWTWNPLVIAYPNACTS